MDYIAALRQLQRRDDWERSGSAADAARWDLRRMHSLLARLDNPHLGRHTIHVAGSKGKGSVAAMTDSMLRAAVASTGLHTKPHLHRFVERIVMNGAPIEEPWKPQWLLMGNSDFPEREAYAEVPPGHVFLLGDNRDYSKDSRFWEDSPFLDIDRIKGRALIIYWSWLQPSRIGTVIR